MKILWWLPLICFAFSKNAYADSVPYSASVTLVANEGALICIHEHDYSRENWIKNKIVTDKNYSVEQNFFKRLEDKNFFENLGHVYCQRNEKQLFKIKSPPFSKIYVQNQMFFGISNVKRGNNVQYMAMSIAGEILLRGHISPSEICLNKEEWQEFLNSDQHARSVVPYATNVSDIFHLDIVDRFYSYIFWPSKSKYINHDHACSSHLSPFFDSSVSNYVYWYDETNPDPSLVYNGEKKTWHLRIKDPTGVYIHVP